VTVARPNPHPNPHRRQVKRHVSRMRCTADPGPPRTSLWRSRVCSAPRLRSVPIEKRFGRAALRPGHTPLASKLQFA
jgi:hypothetical protein